jgi:hypothetical protein
MEEKVEDVPQVETEQVNVVTIDANKVEEEPPKLRIKEGLEDYKE